MVKLWPSIFGDLEAILCAEQLSLTEYLGVSNIIMLICCLEVINMKEKRLCSYSAILFEIDKRKMSFEDVKFQYEK